MILMADFKKEYNFFKKDLDLAFLNVMKSGHFIAGKNLTDFEKNFAEYLGAKYCIGVGNGLEALQISLLVLGIGSGDEVITQANSFVATALAVSNTGAKPVLVDIDEYHHIDLADLERKITKKTKAIIPVHLYGQSVDISGVKKIAKMYGLKIIEDACQAHGTAYKGKKLGSWGDLGCFSFYPTKNLGAFGDGGAIVTNSKKLYEKCLLYGNYGQKKKYEHSILGMNSRLDELQAALLNVKIKKLDYLISLRQQAAKWYFQNLSDVKEVKLPKLRKDSTHTYHLFVVEVESREELQKYLLTKGVQTLVHYPIPIHKQPCYVEEFKGKKFIKTERASENILSLPLHPFITKEEVNKVCNLIKVFYRGGRND